MKKLSEIWNKYRDDLLKRNNIPAILVIQILKHDWFICNEHNIYSHQFIEKDVLLNDEIQFEIYNDLMFFKHKNGKLFKKKIICAN